MNQPEKIPAEPTEPETRAMRLQTLVSELLLKNQKLREEIDRLQSEKQPGRA